MTLIGYRSVWFAAGCAAIAAAPGCGGGVTTPSTGGSGGGSSSSSTSASSSSASSSSGGGGADACADYLDQTPLGSMTVRFQNDSGQDIYIPATCWQLDYSVSPTSGDDGVHYAYVEDCLQSCEELQTQAPYVCGACLSSAYYLAAGASLDVTWNGDGLLYDPGMPNSCYAYPDQQLGECSQRVAAPAGEYRFSAVGYASCDSCACDADTGLCNGEAGGLQATSDSVKANFPGEGLVEVTFGGCAFPCP